MINVTLTLLTYIYALCLNHSFYTVSSFLLQENEELFSHTQLIPRTLTILSLPSFLKLYFRNTFIHCTLTIISSVSYVTGKTEYPFAHTQIFIHCTLTILSTVISLTGNETPTVVRPFKHPFLVQVMIPNPHRLVKVLILQELVEVILFLCFVNMNQMTISFLTKALPFFPRDFVVHQLITAVAMLDKHRMVAVHEILNLV